MKLRIFFLVCCFLAVNSQKNPHFVGNRSTIVHLFEWKWLTIAKECEDFLSVKGYGGVQISPPNENLVLNGRPWYERYQPTSYRIVTRSGNENEFKEMTRRCNKVGVRIYADVVINHMTSAGGIGIDGSRADPQSKSYPSVPYGWNDFHTTCNITNYNDATMVRNCELLGLKDLNQGSEYVRGKIVDFLNHLIDLGVGGFRVDAAKHIWPADLAVIYSRLKNLNTAYNFPENARPYIVQEVPDNGAETIKSKEYTPLGQVTEFKYGTSIGRVFQGLDKLTYLVNWGPGWAFIKKSEDALVFVDNHDTQRNGDPNILYFAKSKQYKMAVSFMLAHPYGQPRVMSSFRFSNSGQGPPSDGAGNLIPPTIKADICSDGWVCEHRWRQIYNMASFRAATKGRELKNWWSNGDQQIAFCRGNVGFVAFTQGGNLDRDLNVCVPPGRYCDIISGGLIGGKCIGKVVEVRDGSVARIRLYTDEYDGVLAIFTHAKL